MIDETIGGNLRAHSRGDQAGHLDIATRDALRHGDAVAQVNEMRWFDSGSVDLYPSATT